MISLCLRATKIRIVALMLTVFTQIPTLSADSSVRSIADAASSRLPTLEARIELSPDAFAVAQELNLYPQIGRVDDFKHRVEAYGNNARSIEALWSHQDLFEAKQHVANAVLGASLEIDYVLSAVSAEENDYRQIISTLESRRDKGIIINTVVAQLTNGFMWSLSGIFSMVAIDHAQASNPDGICSIVAGSVPSVLALYALYQMRGPKCRVPDHPNMLAPLLSGTASSDGYYPDHVLKFLNSPEPSKKSSISRKDDLVDRWTKSGLISKGGAVPQSKKIQAMSGTVEDRRRISISLLQDRLSMLSDVSAEVLKMKRGLLELMPLLQ